MHPMNDVSLIRKIALYVSLPALLVAVVMTFQFGRSMSLPHAVCLGLLTIAGSIIFPYAKHLKANAQSGAVTFAVIGIAFLSVEYFSHLGYTIGTRVTEMEATDVVNAVYDNNQAGAKDDAKNLDIWRTQLSELQQKQPWVATVKADGLRSQISVAQKEVDLETARGGCKSKCALRMKAKADLEEKVASIEQAEDLSKRIEATQRILDGKRTTANKTEFHTSTVKAQTNFVAQLVTQSLDPDRASMTWTQIAIGALVSLVSTFLAPVMLTMALGPVGASETKAAKPNAKPADALKSTFAYHAAGDNADDVRRRASALEGVVRNMKDALQHRLPANPLAA